MPWQVEVGMQNKECRIENRAGYHGKKHKTCWEMISPRMWAGDVARSITFITSAYRVLSGDPGGLGKSGLGLSLCKKVIDAHRGTITVKSHPGKGITFTITLPRNNRTLKLRCFRGEAGQ
jgi:hypothetical protein